MDLVYIKELHFFLFPACNWKKKKNFFKEELKSSKQRMDLIQGRKILVKLCIYAAELVWVR